MGSEEILKIFRDSPGIMLTATEVAMKSSCSEGSAKKTLRRLLKDVSEHLEFRPLTPEEKLERYGRVIGVKVYLFSLNE